MVPTTTPNPDDTPASTWRWGAPPHPVEPAGHPPLVSIAKLLIYDDTELAIIRIALTEFALHMENKSPALADETMHLLDRLA